VSVSTVDSAPETVFAKQFAPLEAHVKASGLPFTLFRLPTFVDNNWGNLQSIKGQGKIYGSVRPDAKSTNVVVNDVGVATATVFGEPSKHAGKTYNLGSATYTSVELAQAFSAATGKTVEYVQIPYENVKQVFLGFGMPEWQVDGLLELFRLVDDNKYVFADDFATVTGTAGTTIQQWTAQVGGAFQ
jgi:uncharacterized protein YbjT (DUF2867 family)